jgi:Uma2 family endonuclease
MSDNTLQDQWIDRIKGELESLYRTDPNVFVASNLMWYPVEGNNRRRLAPDVMVAFGRPKGYRASYVQHKEDHVPPQVVFEILSPGNRKRVMDFKRKIYEMYGVQEYYVFNPYKIILEVWVREGDHLTLIPEPSGWVSPLMGIRFELAEDMTIFTPDDRPFVDFAEVTHQREESDRKADEERRRAKAADRRAKAADRRAEEAELRANQERRRAEEAELRANQERLRTEQLAAKLRELGIDPDA